MHRHPGRMVALTLTLAVVFSIGMIMESPAASPNPCNPCAAKTAVQKIRHTNITDQAALVAWGKKLWNDPTLGNSGLACQSCHVNYALLNLDKVGSFPHYVKMPNDIVTLDQMINFCMINPMQAKPLDANGLTMTALAGYYQQIVADYKAGKGFKAAAKMNPCAAKMNPCAAKTNPCAAKMNPCAAKMNPCNPCAGKKKR